MSCKSETVAGTVTWGDICNLGDTSNTYMGGGVSFKLVVILRPLNARLNMGCSFKTGACRAKTE